MQTPTFDPERRTGRTSRALAHLLQQARAHPDVRQRTLYLCYVVHSLAESEYCTHLLPEVVCPTVSVRRSPAHGRLSRSMLLSAPGFDVCLSFKAIDRQDPVLFAARLRAHRFDVVGWGGIMQLSDNDRLHAGQVVRLGRFRVKRCPACQVARTLAEFSENGTICNCCEARGLSNRAR